jgi:hypothetical protein
MINSEASVEPHSARLKRRRILLFTFYSSTGITNTLLLIMFGVWTDWYWWGAMCCVSLLGSLLLLAVAFVSLSSPQTAARIGILAAILTWLSFGQLFL